eukprot:467844_1
MKFAIDKQSSWMFNTFCILRNLPIICAHICPDDAGCNIQCLVSNACHSMTIISGNDDNTGNSARLTVSCSQSNSCPYATFDGISAYELSITGCIDSNSCIGITGIQSLLFIAPLAQLLLSLLS